MKIELNYLTDDPKKRLVCHDYWLQDDNGFVFAVKEVGHKHGLQSRGLSELVSQWCQAYSPEDACSQCGERYRTYKSRSQYTARKSRPSSWICSACQQHNVEEVKRKRAIKKEQVRRYFAARQKGVACFQKDPVFTPNTLKNVTALLSTIRVAATEDLAYIRPIHELGEQRLSPTDEYDTELILELTGQGILRPNVEHSPVDAFVFDEEGEFTGRYHIFYVAYDIPMVVSSEFETPIDDPAYLIETLEQVFLKMDWPEPWYDQWGALWKEGALDECLRYLDLCMTEHGFEFSPGTKTRQVLNSALTTFSVAQVYNFIWGSARNAAAYYMRARIPKRQAANSVVGAIQRRADQARAEGWEVKAFRRNWRCPQTMFSQVLFDTVLQIGEEGFTKPPSGD